MAWSLITVVLIATPNENKTLQFLNTNGVVNLFMFITSYFFEPYSEDDFSYEENETGVGEHNEAENETE